MRVLVAIDDSPCSTLALNEVAERSWSEETEFCLLTVMEPLFANYGFVDGYITQSMVGAEHDRAEYFQKWLDCKVADLRKVFGLERVTGTLLEGKVASSIVEQAKLWNADLLIVGSHGRQGVQRFFLGSVAESVAGHAPCSIEIVKEKQPLASKEPLHV